MSDFKLQTYDSIFGCYILSNSFKIKEDDIMDILTEKESDVKKEGEREREQTEKPVSKG